jgi:outer membrane lipoprotein
MVSHGFRATVILSLVALSACAPVISPEWRKEALKDLTFEQVRRAPSAYAGSIVIWGGVIISTVTRTSETEITVLETPLGTREKPESGDYTGGRFIAVTPLFLDPVVYARGRKITVAGQIAGAVKRPLGKSMPSYSYPILSIKQIYLWSIPEYSRPDYWWYGGSDGLWGDELYGPGVGEEGFEEGGERGIEEQRENPAEERGEDGRY